MLLLATALAWDQWPPPPANPVVRSAYDGDTLTLENGDKVRLSWVNTPELKPAQAYGKEARDFTRNLVVGRNVTLILQGENPRDGYGRLLSGVLVGETNLSYALLQQGLGHVFIVPPEAYDMRGLLEAQRVARRARRGIWGDEHYQGAFHMTSFHANANGDDNENLNGEYLRIANISDGPASTAGYTITKAAGISFALPTAVIPEGHTFTLHTGRGADRTDPKHPIQLHLQQDQPIWNNTREKATLFDPFGKVVDWWEHETKGN